MTAAAIELVRRRIPRLMAGPGMPGDSLNLLQLRRLMPTTGFGSRLSGILGAGTTRGAVSIPDERCEAIEAHARHRGVGNGRRKDSIR
jgi:hypothetical protein